MLRIARGWGSHGGPAKPVQVSMSIPDLLGSLGLAMLSSQLPTSDIERQLGAASYSFITAWNPAPHAASVDENMEADLRLQARLKQSGHVHHSALGSNAQGGAVEYGWVVLDMSADASDALAREFAQAGLLFWEHGEAVLLRMLWPRPPGIADDACTDWVS